MSLAVPGLDTTASTNDHQDAQSKLIADLLKRIDTLNDENSKLKTQLRLRTQQSSTQHKQCLKEKTFEERAKKRQHSNTVQDLDLGEGTSSCTTQHSVKVSATSGSKKKAQTFGLPSASPGREDVRTRDDGEAGSSRNTHSSLAVQQKRRGPAMVEAAGAKQMRANLSRGNKGASTSEIAQQLTSSAVDVPTNAVSARVSGIVDDDDVILVEENEDIYSGNGGFTPCNKPRCGACHFAPDTKTIKSSRNKKIFKIKHNITCESSNVIYVITCKKCGTQYTGQTTTKLKTRFSNHRSAIKRDQGNLHIAKHYKQKDHSMDDMELTGVELVADASELYERESKWIWSLETHSINGGLNVEEPLLIRCKPPAL